MEIITLLTGCLAYLIGAIPTGYIIAKIKGINDIREHGSGNIGATNVSRVLGKKYFFLIFFLDAGKAYLFINLAKHYFDFNYLCLFAAILLFGNGCSIFLHGGGGKGVATLGGLLIALNTQAAWVLCGIWAIILLLSRNIGIASVVAVACFTPYVYLTSNNPYFIYQLTHTPFYLFSLFASNLILWKHRSNIRAYWNL